MATGAGELRMGTAAGHWLLATTVLGSGLAMIDATVVNVALESIGADLDAGFTGLQWTVNAYTLTLAALILLGGSLGDHFGRRRVFLVGVVWFAVASLICGLAPNIGTLIAARALQGIGGALLTPGSLALISASFHGPDRAAAVGVWSGLGGIAGAVGPFLGGWLVEWSWRAVFLINLPLAAAIVVVALRHVPESRDTESAAGLDRAGTVLAALGLGALTWSLTGLGHTGPNAALLVGLVVGLAALVAFVLVQRWSRHPLVPPSLFADATFSAANAVTLLIYAALGVVFLLLVLQLQIVAGFSPLAAGTALLPVTVVMLVLSAGAGALASRIGPRLPLTVGPLVSAGGLVLMLRVDATTSWVTDVLPAVLVFGLGLALTVAPLTATVLDAAPDRYAGAASGVNNAVARSAQLLAVAAVPGLAGIGGAGYTDPARFAAGFRAAMLIATGLLVAAGAVAFVLLRGRLGGGQPGSEPAGERLPVARLPVERCAHCGVSAPQLHPADRTDP
jgi:EmrB/QacA subfamily drug resistance transporter